MRKHWMALGALVLLGAGCSTVAAPEITGEEVAELEALLAEVIEDQIAEAEDYAGGEVTLGDGVIGTEEIEVSDDTDEPVVAARIGSYIDYSEQAVAEAVERGDKVVLFFYAVWCPFCKQLDNELEYTPDVIPEGVTIIKTDYDTESALKNQYGVRFQHTFVQIDSDREMITSWLGGGIPELELNLQ